MTRAFAVPAPRTATVWVAAFVPRCQPTGPREDVPGTGEVQWGIGIQDRDASSGLPAAHRSAGVVTGGAHSDSPPVRMWTGSVDSTSAVGLAVAARTRRGRIGHGACARRGGKRAPAPDPAA